MPNEAISSSESLRKEELFMSAQQVLERMPTKPRLQGKIAVITGAGSGMGLAIATRFAAEGAMVVAGDWNAARLDQAVADIRESGGTIVGAQGNIADQTCAETLVDLALSTHG